MIDQHREKSSQLLLSSLDASIDNRIGTEIYETSQYSDKHDDEETREARAIKIQEYKKKFQKNPHDKQLKKEYFTVLKDQYGERPAINPYAS